MNEFDPLSFLSHQSLGDPALVLPDGARTPRRQIYTAVSHTMCQRTLPRAEAGVSVGYRRVTARASAARFAGLVCFVPQRVTLRPSV